MTRPTHAQLVTTLKKPGADILAKLTPQQADLIHMAIGVAGESGELLDAVKKFAIYQKPIDMENIIEELGDIEFFLEGIRQILSIMREHTLQANITKLSKRYEGLVYSDQRAIDRADKVSA